MFDDPQNPVTTFKHWLKELNFGIRHLSVDKQRNVIRLGRESVLETLYQDGAMIDPKFTLQLETYVPSPLNSTFEEIKGGAPWVQAYKNGSYRILLKCTSKSAVPATEKNLPIFDFFQRVSRAYLSEENLVYSLLAHRDDPMKFFVNFCHTLCSKCDTVEFRTEKARESIRIDQDDLKCLEKVFNAIKEYIEEHLDEHGADKSIIEEFFIDQGLQDSPE